MSHADRRGAVLKRFFHSDVDMLQPKNKQHKGEKRIHTFYRTHMRENIYERLHARAYI